MNIQQYFAFETFVMKIKQSFFYHFIQIHFFNIIFPTFLIQISREIERKVLKQTVLICSRVFKKFLLECTKFLKIHKRKFFQCWCFLKKKQFYYTRRYYWCVFFFQINIKNHRKSFRKFCEKFIEFFFDHVPCPLAYADNKSIFCFGFRSFNLS